MIAPLSFNRPGQAGDFLAALAGRKVEAQHGVIAFRGEIVGVGSVGLDHPDQRLDIVVGEGLGALVFVCAGRFRAALKSRGYGTQAPRAPF